MRNLFQKHITELAKTREDIVLMSGDIGNKMFDNFKKIAPERFINCGIAEANMMSVAAGLAISGLRPVVYTITPFITARCFEQAKISVGYHDANVLIIGTGSGLSYSELGATHHSLEDISIMSSIPNMRIMAPCDPNELRYYIDEALKSNGPTYIRIGKKGEPTITQNSKKISFGRSNLIKDGEDYLILAIGPIINEALEAATKFESRNKKSIAIASMSSIKPLDNLFLKNMLERKFKVWITLEEHAFEGGLGIRINNWLFKNDSKKIVKTLNLNTPEEFIHSLGKQDFLREELGINHSYIYSKLISL